MSYIGNEPTSVAFLTDTFSGNGSTTAFTLSAAPATTSSILVAITGVLQDPSTYSVSGTTLTFSPAPPTGTGNISVRFLGIPASGVTTTAYRTVTEFTATSGQTTFNVPSYTVGFIDVYQNGVMLGSADYTATSGLTVVLAIGATVGDLVEVISFQVSSILNAIPASPASVQTSYLVDGSVTAAKLASGAALSNLGTAQLADANMAPGSVIQVVSTAKTDTYSASVASGGQSGDVTGLSCSITPSNTSNKVLVTFAVNVGCITNQYVAYTAYCNGSIVAAGDAAGSRVRTTASSREIRSGDMVTIGMTFLHSPSSTSQQTYTIRLYHGSGGTQTLYVNRTYDDTDANYSGRGISTITAQEIAG